MYANILTVLPIMIIHQRDRFYERRHWPIWSWKSLWIIELIKESTKPKIVFLYHRIEIILNIRVYSTSCSFLSSWQLLLLERTKGRRLFSSFLSRSGGQGTKDSTRHKSIVILAARVICQARWCRVKNKYAAVVMYWSFIHFIIQPQSWKYMRTTMNNKHLIDIYTHPSN